MKRFVALMSLVVLCACGAAPPPVSRVTEAEIEAANTPAPAPPETQGSIVRADLESVVAAGLGRFLGYVGTEPHLDNGAFVGHRITALRGEVLPQSGLQLGDTVVAVNGQSVERPEQAMAVWNSLSVASELSLDVLRAGEPQTLRFRIVD